MYVVVDLVCSTRRQIDIREDLAILPVPKGLAHFSLVTSFSTQGWYLQQAVNVPLWGN